MRIRKTYINNIILNIYRSFSEITYPFPLESLINITPNCRILTYKNFSEINQCTHEDVEQICNSKSGCTFYDTESDKYLVLYNDSTIGEGRQLWTIAHEIGHIHCGHFQTEMAQEAKEKEADYFAATLLCPLPICQLMNIEKWDDIQNVFGLSKEASDIREKEIIQWNKSHIKTAWENDMKRVKIKRQFA